MTDDLLIKRLFRLNINFLKYISENKNLPSITFLDNVFDILNLRHDKRITLCLIGPSNTGKTFLTNLITCIFADYEIGNIIPPSKDTLTDFWSSNCVYSSIKRYEKFFIPTVTIPS